MAGKKVKTRTVRFFEIVDHESAGPLAAELPWSTAIENLGHSDISADDRTVTINGEDHHGGPWSLSGHPEMLLLSRIRADFELPDIFDRRLGTVEALEIAESEGVAETTHVGFFPMNIVGMIRTNTTPGATSLEKWINNMDLFQAIGNIDVLPLSRVAIQSRVDDIDRARGVKVRMRSTAGQAVSGVAPRIGDVVETLQQQFGDVTIEMRIYLTNDEGHTAEAENILAEAQGLIALTATGDTIEGVQAASLSYLSLERERGDEINILKDKLAERVEVEVVDDEGRTTRRESAARAMQLAYTRLQPDLEAAVNRDRG